MPPITRSRSIKPVTRIRGWYESGSRKNWAVKGKNYTGNRLGWWCSHLSRKSQRTGLGKRWCSRLCKVSKRCASLKSPLIVRLIIWSWQYRAPCPKAWGLHRWAMKLRKVAASSFQLSIERVAATCRQAHRLRYRAIASHCLASSQQVMVSMWVPRPTTPGWKMRVSRSLERWL